MKMQHFDMESTVFERGGSFLYISVKKSFSTFLTFFPILAYISLSAIDNMVPFYTDAHIWFPNTVQILILYNLILDSLLPISKMLTHQNLLLYWDFSPCFFFYNWFSVFFRFGSVPMNQNCQKFYFFQF